MDKRVLKLRAPENLITLLDRVAYWRRVPRSRLALSILADGVRDFSPIDTLSIFSIVKGKINLSDQLLARLISVETHGGELFCTFCRSYSCSHVQRAKRFLVTARRSIFSSMTTLDHLGEKG